MNKALLCGCSEVINKYWTAEEDIRTISNKTIKRIIYALLRDYRQESSKRQLEQKHFKGVLHPLLKCCMFCALSQSYHPLLGEKYSKLLDENSQVIVLIKTHKPIGLLKIEILFWVPSWTIYSKIYIQGVSERIVFARKYFFDIFILNL